MHIVKYSGSVCVLECSCVSDDRKWLSFPSWSRLVFTTSHTSYIKVRGSSWGWITHVRRIPHTHTLIFTPFCTLKLLRHTVYLLYVMLIRDVSVVIVWNIRGFFLWIFWAIEISTVSWVFCWSFIPCFLFTVLWPDCVQWARCIRRPAGTKHHYFICLLDLICVSSTCLYSDAFLRRMCLRLLQEQHTELLISAVSLTPHLRHE